MIIKSLKLKNWLLFRNAEITFDDDIKVIGVVGNYDQDLAGKSNRSGKTTIVEAIKYLLYGKGRSGQQVKLINRAALADGGEMYVEAVIEKSSGESVTLRRGRTNDNKALNSIDGMVANVEELGSEISEFVDFDFDEYVNTCYFGQGDIHQFMKSDPRDKRSLILKWLRQERWGERKRYAKDKVDELQSTLDASRQALQAISEGEIESVEILEQQLAEAEKVHGKVVKQLEEFRSGRKVLTDQIKQAQDVIRLVALVENNRKWLDEKRIELRAAKKKKAIRDQKIEEHKEVEQERAKDTKKWNDVVSDFQKKHFQADTNFKQAEKKYQKVKKSGGVCPLLGEGCDRIKQDAVSLEQDVSQFNTLCNLAYIELRNTEKKREESLAELIAKSGELTREINQNRHSDIKGLRKEIGELESNIEFIEEKIEGREDLDLEQLQGEQEDLDGMILGISHEKESAAVELQSCKYKLSQAQKSLARRKELQGKIEVIENQREAWLYTAFMFGDRGIPGEIMTASFASLEEDINLILDRLHTNLSVEFQPWKETNRWESECLACSHEFKSNKIKKCPDCDEQRTKKRKPHLVLTIHDLYEGETSEFDLDSGGGQTLISFAVRLALLFLKVRESGQDIPPIILDEVLGMLDPVNRSAVIDLALNTLVKQYGVSQVFVISHNEEIQDSIENVLAVTRQGNQSTVVWQ